MAALDKFSPSTDQAIAAPSNVFSKRTVLGSEASPTDLHVKGSNSNVDH